MAEGLILKVFFVLGALSLLALAGFLNVSVAADYYVILNNSAGTYVSEWSVTRYVDNNCDNNLFIPTKTSTEWSTFRNYNPPFAPDHECANPLSCSKVQYTSCTDLMDCYTDAPEHYCCDMDNDPAPPGCPIACPA